MYAHVALHRFNVLPSTFHAMDRKEKAFIIASIQIEQKKEKEAQNK